MGISCTKLLLVDCDQMLAEGGTREGEEEAERELDVAEEQVYEWRVRCYPAPVLEE